MEDAAEALGSFRDGVHVGREGVRKLAQLQRRYVTTGGRGVLLTRDPALAARAKRLTTTVRRVSGWVYDHDEVGWNYRLPNLNAAVGVAQLEGLDDMLARKRAVADRSAAAQGATLVGAPLSHLSGGEVTEGVSPVRLLLPRGPSTCRSCFRR